MVTKTRCESTAWGASYRDHSVFFLADATATDSEEMHLASLLNLAYGSARVTTANHLLRTIRESFSGHSTENNSKI